MAFGKCVTIREKITVKIQQNGSRYMVFVEGLDKPITCHKSENAYNLAMIYAYNIK